VPDAWIPPVHTGSMGYDGDRWRSDMENGHGQKVKWYQWLPVLLLLASPVLAQPPEPKPHFDTMKEWQLHFSLGIVVLFEEEDGLVWYSYPILAQYPVNGCEEYSYHDKEVYLFSTNMRYVI